MKEYNKLSTIGYVNKECPLSYYPRPTLKRKEEANTYLNLNGIWNYEIIKERDFTDLNSLSFSKEILVPYPIESSLSMVEKRLEEDELLIYKKVFKFNPKEDLTILHFGAIDNECKVFINGNLVGTHVGGYLPFSFDISKYLKEENELVVLVKDTLDNHHPYGKQCKKNGGIWYTPVSGIWKTVWLESVNCEYITDISYTTNIDEKKLFLNIKENGEPKKKKISIYLENELVNEIEDTNSDIEISFSEISLWNTHTPTLYTLVISTETDKVESYFAFRKIEIRKRDNFNIFYLNNEPIYMHGLLDQGFYPDGLYTPKALETVLNDLLMVKDLGFNTLRKHIKIEDENWYYLCDKLGIIVWQDFVNSMPYSFFKDSALPTIGIRKLKDKGFSKLDKEFFINHSIETINFLKNHPSIVLWTIFNEGWGQFDTDDSYLKISKYDDTRIYDVTSGWFDESKHTKLDSRHVYFKPIKIDSKDERALVISEFGGYSLNTPSHMYSKKTFGYKGYKNKEEYNKGFLELFKRDIIANIPKGVCASIYTQLSDVEEEINGIVTYDREVIKLDREIAELISKEIHGTFKG